MKKYIRTILPLAVAFAMASCTEITDYPDGSINFDEVFQSEKLTAGWLNNCYLPMSTSHSSMRPPTTPTTSTT